MFAVSRLRFFCAALLGLLIAGQASIAPADEAADFKAAFYKARELEAGAHYGEAAKHYEYAYKLAPRVYGPNARNVHVVADSLATCYKHIGRYADAERLMLINLKFDEATHGPHHADVGVTANNLASVYQLMGQPAKAEPLYVRALAIHEKSLPPNHPTIVTGLNNLGTIYHDLGQHKKAETIHLRCLKIREATLPPDHPDIALSTTNLGNAYFYLGDREQAEKYYERSLAIERKVLAPDHPSIALSLANLASLKKDQSKFDEAEKLHLEAIAINEKRLGPEHAKVGSGVFNLANVYKVRGDVEKAAELYHRSLTIFEKSYGPHHPSLAQLSLRSLGNLYAGAGDLPKAAEMFERSRRIVRRYIASVLPVLNEKEQLIFLENVDQWALSIALSLGLVDGIDAKIAEQTAGWLVNGKAVAQQSLAEKTLLQRDLVKSERTAKRLIEVRQRLTELTQVEPNSEEAPAREKELEKLAAEEQQLAAQLGRSDRGAGVDPWIEIADVRRKIPAEGLLVDIARIDLPSFAKTGARKDSGPRYVAWISPPAGKGDVRVVDLGETEPIDDAVKAFQNVMAATQSADKAKNPLRAHGEAEAEKAVIEPLAAIARLVLEPLAPHLKDAKQLVLSPDGNLWLVPWAALPVAGDEGKTKYAVEQWRIRYVVSGRDLVQTAAFVPSKNAPIVFANPDFDLNSRDAAANTQRVLGAAAPQAVRGAPVRSMVELARVLRLPGTAAEAKLITPALEKFCGIKPIVYEDRYALEGIFRALRSPRVLVLSTHGYFWPEQTTAAAAEDTAAEAAGAPATRTSRSLTDSSGAAFESPLLRCGLLLAGCNIKSTAAGLDDGILTGRDIISCDLRGTELVVLSACETGLGQVNQGEGVAGLRQAFQLAGAKTVVATLWQIPDKDTAQLMATMFSSLAAGEDKAAALQAAQLEIIKYRRERHGAAHPLFWAAFTVTGN